MMCLAVLSAGLLTACNNENSNTNSETSKTEKIIIKDQLGKTIELDGVPEKVCTTIMPFPYIYYAVVGNSDNLIGCNPSSIVAYENSVLKYMYPELANANTDFVDTEFVVNVEEILKLQPDRYLCFFFTGKKIIVTNAYHKKSDKLPPNEKSTALKNMAAYKKAVDEKNKNGKGE